jgi:hypothetical protein
MEVDSLLKKMLILIKLETWSYICKSYVLNELHVEYLRNTENSTIRNQVKKNEWDIWKDVCVDRK